LAVVQVVCMGIQQAQLGVQAVLAVAVGIVKVLRQALEVQAHRAKEVLGVLAV
jgi:hypothetical protein